MNDVNRTQLIDQAQLTQSDLQQIRTCRQKATKLGFGYQLSFVRLLNRFPDQQPFEINEDLLDYIGLQLKIPPTAINTYATRQATVSDHRERICHYLGLERFTENKFITTFIFEQACRLEQTHALLAHTKSFLRLHKILEPAQTTLVRLIKSQRQKARIFIFERITTGLDETIKENLDALLVVDGRSPLQILKETPHRASPSALLRLTDKLDRIAALGIPQQDLSWLNNNFQRAMARYARRATAARLRELETQRRYSVLICFLHQCYRDTMDELVTMYDKLINQIYNRAQRDLDHHTRTQSKQIRKSLSSFRALADLVLDESISDQSLRHAIFSRLDRSDLEEQLADVQHWLTGKHSDVFLLVRERFSYIRQFAPALVAHLYLDAETDTSILKAVDLLDQMNVDSKRRLPDDAPLDFLPKKLQSFVKRKGHLDKGAWECALLTTVRDQIKSGNLSVKYSKRFARLDDFFMPEQKWTGMKEAFFKKAGLPSQGDQAASYLTKRLNQAYDKFLKRLPDNAFAKLTDLGWEVTKDQTEKRINIADLEKLKADLNRQMRVIKLPQLLIEVDNELHFSHSFMAITKRPSSEDICEILAAIIAHGCNIGPYTMSYLIEGVSYGRLKHISDWMLTEEAQRSALARLVDAISQLDITQAWGQGHTSSSDGQRFGFRRKVLNQSYSTQFKDFALEFYSFIADNYAPFYSMPIECTDRDAPHVLDGLLYNESDLPLEEHFTDTHGYTEINFAAFAMLGKRFSPRIKGIQKQRIYCVDRQRDYGPLSVLLERRDRTIHMSQIASQWDRLGHFYASLESGHTTASVALKRLNGFTGKNHFYRANRELGRIFKTEHILQYMSDAPLRHRTREGLLKSEQLHALARDLNYGKRGHLHGRDWLEQRNSCSCLTLILACIIYWQAKEIHRVLLENEGKLDISLVKHISPITWNNVILYGEYVLDRNLIRL